MTLDSDVLCDIQNYRKILKSVLKSQIQLLVQQLFEQTGEETVLLSANVSNQSLSHLGSESGKAFLKDFSDVKNNFLSFCVSRAATTYKSPPTGNPSATHSSVAATKKPYNRLGQRRFSRFRQNGKQGSSLYRSSFKDRQQSPYGSQDDLSQVQGHSEVKVTSAPSSQASFLGQLTLVKKEPEEPATKDDAAIPTATMETENATEPVKNNDSTMNATTSVELPLEQASHSVEPSTSFQNPSKRKQSLPIRISKNISMMTTQKNVSTPHILSENDIKPDMSQSQTGSSNLVWLGSQKKPGRPGDHFKYVNLKDLKNEPAEDMSEYSPNAPQFASAGGQEEEAGWNTTGPGPESSSSQISWTEESPLGKSYMKTPQVDGVFVSRGLGRYEKLIRCDTCGKVCRTSNMARHKKRYCAALPEEARGKRRSLRVGPLVKSESDIYIDNPNDDSFQDMNGSGYSVSMETDGHDSSYTETDPRFDTETEPATGTESDPASDPKFVIIKQEPPEHYNYEF